MLGFPIGLDNVPWGVAGALFAEELSTESSPHITGSVEPEGSLKRINHTHNKEESWTHTASETIINYHFLAQSSLILLSEKCSIYTPEGKKNK